MSTAQPTPRGRSAPPLPIAASANNTDTRKLIALMIHLHYCDAVGAKASLEPLLGRGS
jgi:hypothetical protein